MTIGSLGLALHKRTPRLLNLADIIRLYKGLEYGMDLRIYWFYGPEPTWILQPFVRSSLRSGGGYRETRVGSGGITIGKGFSVDFIGEEALEKLKSRISQLEGGVQS